MRSATCFLIVSFLLCTYASYAQDTLPVTTLRELRQNDRLADWLAARMTYAAEKPRERLPFLLGTQQAAWRQPLTREEEEVWLNLLVNQGYYALYVGDIIASIHAYENAFTYYEKHSFPGFDISEYLFKPLGNNYTRLGDYESALFIQKKGLEHALKSKDDTQTASFYNNLAISYRWLGNLGEAGRMCAAGLSVHHKKDGLFALLKSTSADILFEAGDLQKANDDIGEALHILKSQSRSSTENYWFLSALTLSGDILLSQKKYDAALSRFQEALQLIENAFRGGRKREKANLLNKAGYVFLGKGQEALALQYFNRSITTLIPSYDPKARKSPDASRLFPENRLFDAFEGRSSCYALLKQLENALEDVRLALQVGDLSKNSIFSESDKIRYQKNYKRLTEDGLSLAYELHQRDPDGNHYGRIMLQLIEQSKARTLMEEIQKGRKQLMSSSGDSLFRRRAQLQRAILHLDQEIASGKPGLQESRGRAVYDLKTVEKAIGSKYPRWQQQTTHTNLSVDGLLGQIPDSTVAFNYFFGDHMVYNIILERGKISGIVHMKNADRWKVVLNNYVETYYRQGVSSMMNDPEIFYTQSRQIFDFLMPPSGWQHAKRLLVIPDDVIAYISFESLPVNGAYVENIRKWPFLLRQIPVSYAFSLDTWLLPTRHKDRNSFAGFFLTNTGTPHAEIAAARLEEDYVSDLVNGSFHLNDQSTIASFRKALEKTDVVHISTHSTSRGHHAMPTLQMTDGDYFLFELNVDRQVPGLIVLSACRTAEGALAAGEGPVSLSRGFIAAGTNGTVSGLWNVNDKAAAVQMKLFYQHLLKQQDPAMALHQAKLDWLNIEHPQSAYFLPYYWAALIYTGKDQQVQLAAAYDFRKFWWVAAGVVVLFGFTLVGIRRRKVISDQ